jgi:signal transduction histidine kinase/CheY-like chemotaxis protein
MKRFFSLRSEYSLSNQMLTIFSLGLILFTLIQVISLDYRIKEETVQRAGEDDVSKATFFASLIDSDVAECLKSLNVQATSMHSLGMTTDFRLTESMLNLLQKLQPKFAWIGYADREGKIKAATQSMLVGKDVTARPWFSQGQLKQTTIDVHDALMLAKMLQEKDDQSLLRFIDVASPTTDKNGKVLGVLAAHLSISWLDERISFYTSTTNSEIQEKPFVTGHDGLFRFGNKETYEGLENLGNLWRSQNSSGYTFLNHKKLGLMLVSYSKHKSLNLPNEMGWVTVIATPIDKIIAHSLHHRVLAMCGILGLALLVWGLVFWLFKRVNKPIDELIKAINEANQSGGKLRELNGLPKEFVLIRNQINDLLTNLQDSEKTLRDALAQINTSFNGVTKNFPGVLFSLEDRRNGLFDFTYLSESVYEYFALDEIAPVMLEKFLTQVLTNKSPENVQLIQNHFANTQPIDMVLETLGKANEVRQIRWKANSRYLNNGSIAWDGIAVDITDLIKTQQSAAAADEAKSRFLATMSHEIRTPLNGILGFAQILQQELTDVEARQDVQKIIDTADTLTRILNDILDFSKIESGKLEIESRPFTFIELTNSVGELFKAETQQRGIDFALNLSGEPGLTLLGDPTRLRQIITNLVSNAIKFTSQGQVTLSIRISPAANNRSQVLITVKDTGIGITKEHIQRLFQRFEQSDATTYRQYGGSGLGLAIVKGLIDSMNGRISVQSKVGQGTTFTIDTEFQVITNSSAVATYKQLLEVPALKILVVDDVETNRHVVCRGLKRDGHEFYEAADGLQALSLAQSMKFDLILMDLDMPVMGGFESAREIRHDSQNKETLIIALSGLAYDKDVAAVMEAGMNMHMAKPINLMKLRKKISELFGEKYSAK